MSTGEMKVQLSGKTKKGKERVKQHGEWWVVLDLGMPEILDHEPAYLLKPLQIPANDLRWVKVDDDKDFRIENTKGNLVFDLDDVNKG